MASSTDMNRLNAFLEPLRIDAQTVHLLSQRFLSNFEELCTESKDQFLATPISGSILRPVGQRGQGRHLAIDIGGTNLRVGFVELLGREEVAAQTDHVSTNGRSRDNSTPSARVQRQMEMSWPIADHLKSDNADSLFQWIGECIVEVVRKGCGVFKLPSDQPLSLGVTFSFPMVQHALSEATLMSMGKGFAIASNTNLGERLQQGYSNAKDASLPPIEVTAIANDSVSTLVSFIFQYGETVHRRAAMGLILGTGCNATIPLKLGQLHPSKRPANVSLLPGEKVEDVKVTVNTELSINGTAAPLREMSLISRWDAVVDAQNETPGFQPLEYMTAGRYLGELGRIMIVDYLTSVLNVPATTLPARLLQRHSLTTTFLSHFQPLQPQILLSHLKEEFAQSKSDMPFSWTEHHAEAVYHIAKAIEVRAAGIVAAATIALLTLAEELPLDASGLPTETRELGVGYTGGCIVHFQDYLVDCQDFIDGLVEKRFGENASVRVVLSPCHDGGIAGAGILGAAASSSKNVEM